ncbi:hypothetical protein OG738_40895 [Amycolatopsis sp. NBC_01488]|uniref:hypothetical protein n=1 Tax=Amycolatopsis sp. NBC_01488 TaxID=2903563 RepID=UPI002E2E196A|nr:hypothetical protein [Amycolatopsis sp. NBC_01488]
MSWLSAEAEAVGGLHVLRTLRRHDLTPELDAVVRQGWRIIDGAVLLSCWYDSYHGDRLTFSQIMDYEVAVNGRGIPDLDLTEVRNDRVPKLLRRGIAFAWRALHVQQHQFPDIEMSAYISVSPTLFDANYFTGNVTFCAVRTGERPYIDRELLKDEIVAAIFSRDCVIDLD